MDENTAAPVVIPAVKTPLTRKLVIVTGAIAGLIIAGGIAFVTSNADVDTEESASEDDADA